MSQSEALATERRARMAAERLLAQKQTELFAANAELSKHALSLTDEIIDKRQEVEAVKQVSDALRGQNDQAMQDLEQAHEAVDVAERRLWNSVETIEDGFAVFDANGVLVAANSAYLSVFDGMDCVAPGISYADILNIMADEGIVDTEGSERENWCGEMAARWQQEQPEPRVIKLWNQQFVKLVDRHSDSGDTVSLALNITSTIRREEQLTEARNSAEAASKAKSAFLAKMSHELRTPMNGVVGMADLLVEGELDEEQQLYVETIKSSGEALLVLINDVLDFSKMEAAKLTLQQEEFDLERVLSEVLMLFQPAVIQKDVELLIDYDMFLPTRFKGDPGRIRQILTNLIGNAVKFTESGHVMVRVVGLSNGTDNEMRIHVTIEDTGPGIPAEKVDHIFGEFNQVEDENNRRHEGTGLGLAITKQLVEMMGGKIWVDSEFGFGSSFGFFVNLPAIEEPAKDCEQAPGWINRVLMFSHPSQFAGILAKQLRILGLDVVEDTLQVFVDGAELRPGDVMAVDPGNGPESQALVDGALAKNAELGPVILMTSHRDKSHGEIANVTALLKPVERRGFVKALAALERPKGDAATGPIVKGGDDLTDAPGPTDPGAVVDPVPETETPDQIAPVEMKTPYLVDTGGTATRKMRVLAAEDNKTNRLVLSKMIGKLNVDLAFANDGLEAVEKWKSFKPDLIFMDISMPEMDGKQATVEIRKQEAEAVGDRTPICALTAHAMAGDDHDILAAGLDFYLTKPLRKAAIFEQIKAAMTDDVEQVFE